MNTISISIINTTHLGALKCWLKGFKFIVILSKGKDKKKSEIDLLL